mgnify:FL=1
MGSEMCIRDSNNVSHAITDYLVKSNQLSLPLADQKILGSMFYVVNDIERIGDHAENFADFTKTSLYSSDICLKTLSEINISPPDAMSEYLLA